MKNSRLLFLPLLAVLALSGCSSKDVVMPEGALPMESDVVFVFDGDHGGDFGEFLGLIDSFPKRDDQGFIEQAWDSDGTLPEFAKFVKPVLRGDFRVAVGVSELGDVDAIDAGVVTVAAYFEKADAFEDLMMELLKENDVELKASEEDGKKFWSNEATFVARDGDVFVFGMTEESLDEALANLEKGNGFVVLPEAEGRLGYIHVGGEFVGDLLSGVYGSAGGSLGASTVFFDADKRGISFDSEMDLPADADSEAFKSMFGDIGYRVELIDEVRAEKPFAFGEYSSLKSYVEAAAYGFLGQVNAIDPEAVPDNLDVMASLAEMLGMDEVALTEFVDSPLAFVMGDNGALYPTMAFYLGMDKGDLEVAKSLTVKMDGWMASLIGLYDELARAQGFGEGALKREVVGVSGTALHKVYFDFNALPEDVLGAAAFIPGLDVKSLKVELYYGLTAEDHFVVALYPDFAEAYESAPIVSDDKVLKAALKDFDLDNAYMMNVFLPGGFVPIADRWVELAAGAGVFGGTAKEDYDFYAHEVVARFKSMISVGTIEGEKVESRGRLEITD